MKHLMLMRKDYTHVYFLLQKNYSKALNTNQGDVTEPGDGTCHMALEKNSRATLLQKHQFCQEPSGNLHNKSCCWSVFKFSKPLSLRLNVSIKSK